VSTVLQELRIAGLGVIDDAVLVPDAGFTVVTGETGAGKTMIVTALGLVCGGRSDAAQVRAGAGRAVVEARFAPDPDGPAAAVVADVVAGAGGDADEDGSVVAVRSVGADGRSRAHIGGRSAPVSALADLTDSLVIVHGQAEAFSLLRPGRARSLVDRFGNLGEPLAAYRAAREEWSAARRELADRTERARERAQREQLLRTALDEITRVGPRPSEDLELVAEVRRLDDADVLRTAATEAVAALSGSDTGDEPNAAALLQAAGRTLAASSDPLLSARVDDLRGAAAVVGDVVADLLGYLDRLDADPERLGALLERQAALRGLTRRYGQDVDAVLAWAAEAREELEGLDSSEDAVEKLRRRVAELASLVSATGSALSSRRSAAATRLGGTASAELQHLAMGRAQLRVAVERRVATSGAAEAVEVDGIAVIAGADGIDQVEVLLVARPGAPELPVARGASGGELSRVMLALEVALAGADPVPTLVFDEVDAGVGGRAATEIGRRLARLASSHQVIVVTHLAQVAAFASRHYVVDADSDGIVGASSVRSVEGAERQAELARMLGGTDGAAARAHAADLLAAATARAGS
jgi:DNA repair protein RecN (Recombination protein N)